jgi:hypothetical protein
MNSNAGISFPGFWDLPAVSALSPIRQKPGGKREMPALLLKREIIPFHFGEPLFLLIPFHADGMPEMTAACRFF